jgi:hypothetical protein
MRCWEWDGGTNSTGYGRVSTDGKRQLVHRVVYEAIIGPIPDGLQIDHLCRNILCYNPEHLEAVTQKENIRRGDNHNRKKTHCPQGHSYSGGNLMVGTRSDGGISRRCKTCCNAQGRARYAKNGQRGVNNKSKTHCPQGHPYSGENLIRLLNKTHGTMMRRCRTCYRAYNARRKANV